MITPPADRAVRYYCDPLVNGFVVLVGDEPMLVIGGQVAVDWSVVPEAIRHGWVIKGGLCDKSIIVCR